MADELVTWTLVAETTEFVGPITLTVDDVPVAGFQAQVVASGLRPDPDDWEEVEFVDDAWRLLIGAGTSFPLTPRGKYTLYVRHTDSPETPIVPAGIIRAT